MKKVILLLLLFPFPLFSQVADDFETGMISVWTENIPGRWKADTESAISGIYSLHHVFDNPSSGSDCIGIPLANLHPSEGITRWSFRIKHGCDPSATNSWALFLMSDKDPLAFSNASALNGFAAGVNLTGNDDSLRIWKVKNGTINILATCPLNWQGNIGTAEAVKIVIERTREGNWTISAFDKNNNLKGVSSGSDSELFNTPWLILNYRYTSTRDRLLWFDDLLVEGVFYEDRIPPSITGATVTGANSLHITFSEDVSDDILNPAFYSLNDGRNTSIWVTKKNPGAVEVKFRDRFINKTSNDLVIGQLCDLSGNCISNALISFTPAWPETGDIVISEIMADPSPPVSLPGREYIELTNRTDNAFFITGWSLATESQKADIPSFKISPHELVILSSVNDTSVFKVYGKAVGIKSFPSLYDEGRIIWLADSSGMLIHGLEYSSRWYGDKLKEEGGWSLEMTDTGYPFFTDGNWEASSSATGGTPGKLNTASRSNPDNTFRGILNVFPSGNGDITICLSETIVTLDDDPGKVLISDNSVQSIESIDPLMRNFRIKTGKPMTGKRIYILFLPSDLKDFAGNDFERGSFRFGLPEKASGSDIVFNEILFNPMPGDPDFIEFFNCSEKIIDASTLYMASVNTETGDTSELKTVSGEMRCILPGAFYTVTTESEKIVERYPHANPENIFSIPSLVSMPDDKGHLLLLNRQLEVIDELIYSSKMHYSLLSENEGVSLEKIRPGIFSAESMSWHSASANSGWGTPGSENSVFNPGSSSDNIIILSSDRITPDNNGFEDVLVIDLKTGDPGSVVTITVFGETGNFVKRIAGNYLAGERASIVWDATADDGTIVRSGIYIILIELYNDKGKARSWKKVCCVIR